MAEMMEDRVAGFAGGVAGGRMGGVLGGVFNAKAARSAPGIARELGMNAARAERDKDNEEEPSARVRS